MLFLSCVLPTTSCDSNNSNQPANDSSKSDSLHADYDSIVPLADGGAYMISSGEVWYLKGGEAVRVKIVDKLSSQTPSHPPISLNTTLEKSLWALWQNEIAKRKRREALENEPDPDYDGRGY